MQAQTYDIYNAFLQAADHLKTHRDAYRFQAVTVPSADKRETGSACAYGWVCHFLGVPSFMRRRGEAPHLEEYHHFAALMWQQEKWYETSWTLSRKVTIRCLRRYAEKYHAPAKSAPVRAPMVRASIADLFRRVA